MLGSLPMDLFKEFEKKKTLAYFLDHETKLHTSKIKTKHWRKIEKTKSFKQIKIKKLKYVHVALTSVGKMKNRWRTNNI